MKIHIVQQNDTIESIAKLYNVSPNRIIIDNELTTPNLLAIGQSIVILFPDIIHIVKPGDTLTGISATYNVDDLQILRNNPIIGQTEVLFPGQELVITYMPTNEPNNGKIADVELNGYAYPFIDKAVFRKTLPFLTYLSIFTYGFTPEGELIAPVPSDDELITIALKYKVAPIMVLAPMSPEGDFSNVLASAMLNNPNAVNNLIENIILNIKNKNYFGVDIDFEFVLAKDKDLFIDFIAKTSARLRSEGFITMAALAPKSYATQPGLLYEAHDYEQIGALVDRALLMTYEWGYAILRLR
ncbi:MAG TPA: LysM peptidoglycan-binding domain-containing protein [Clostridiales bacterium]|nr:LysM peptidoglycan-binding domain-containing protein [Clostridiales bacterium]